MGSLCNDFYPYKKRQGHKEIHAGGRHVTGEAETGVVKLQAKECQGL